ncbi:protoporphyrinogen oxidase [Cedecea neteri]|uniref:Protoporphyrinogen oxidase n=1 Tax=Cedecea neteri TaxID=158822 RepID=A0A2X3KWF8_9ENTR|nr:protoporphyrinogen oxidase [Cedecea neteri]
MSITRRDFLNGMAIAIVSGLTPLELGEGHRQSARQRRYQCRLLSAEPDRPARQPPGSFEMAHALGREHEKFDFGKLPIEEEYDLVIVGGGISGLAAACFWREKMGKEAKILILDNHDDFGGHAKRNQFNVGGKTLLGYGGSESFQSPNSNFSPVVHGLMDSLGVSITRMKSSFDATFYPNQNLSRGVFFDKKNFGETKIVSGDPGRAVSDDIPPDRLNGRSIEAFINDFPLSEADRKALLDLHVNPADYLQGMTVEQKTEMAG